MYIIMGQYQNNEPEEIDEFNTKEEARAMLGEYIMAYDNDWKLWIVCND